MTSLASATFDEIKRKRSGGFVKRNSSGRKTKQGVINFFSEKANWMKKGRNKMKFSISLVFALQLDAKTRGETLG